MLNQKKFREHFARACDVLYGVPGEYVLFTQFRYEVERELKTSDVDS